MMLIGAHLRDQHRYSLFQSVKYAPYEMRRLHDLEHAETECDHTHNDDKDGD